MFVGPGLNLLVRMTFYGFLPELDMGGIPEFQIRRAIVPTRARDGR